MLPPNFSFIDQFIAGSAAPYTVEHLNTLVSKGISDIFTLNNVDLRTLVENNRISVQIHKHSIFATPDPSTINAFLKITREIRENNRKLLVHCQFGQERTGIMLAIYLKEYYEINIDSAIQQIRELRPGSLRSYAAIDFLTNYY